MDVLFQFVVEVVLEIFGELLFEAGLEGAGRVLRNRWLRYAVGAALGLVFGILWGRQLSGGHGGWRNVLVPPWRWAVHRLVGFAVLNLALAFGIATSFTPAG